jgi:hypothetical protein
MMNFFLIHFHPKGEPEAFICCVTCPPYKTLAGGLRAPNTDYGFALKCLAYESLQFVQNSGIESGSFVNFSKVYEDKEDKYGYHHIFT